MKNLEQKIIICKGNAEIPASLWRWAVCTRGEYINEHYGASGWVESECTKYLTDAQLEYLGE